MLNIRRILKKIILVFFDFFLSILAVCISYLFRYESFDVLPLVDYTNILFPAILFITIIYFFNYYSTLTRFLTFNLIQLFKVFSLFTIIYFLYVFVLSSKINNFLDMSMTLGINPPRSTVLSLPVTLFFLFLFSRQLIVYFINSVINKYNSSKLAKINCVIYGAGNLGNQLKNYLDRYENNYHINAIIDDDIYLQGQYIQETKIISFNNFKNNYLKKNLIVFIAINSDEKSIKKNFYNKFSNYKNTRIIFVNHNNGVLNPLSVKPREIDIDYILGYSQSLDYAKLKLIKNKDVLVTGGGGSIGSELVKQLYTLNPRSITVVDNNEHNLFNINHYFKSSNNLNDKIRLKFILGNIANVDFVKDLFKYNFDYIFHSAAYKHVSLVENNVVSSVENNVISTLNLCKFSKNKVKSFVNVSSDKAVKPKNFMGATKNITEQIIKKFNNLSSKTNFYSVRFGNVLNSSGSVIPIFKDQILHNKPLTITDLKATRYFMSINEAINLILTTLTINNDGKTFYFDMGKPIKILDLAKKLVNFYGKKLVKNSNNFNEVGYQVTGLKKGEKLHEILTTPKNILIKTKEKKILFIKNNKSQNSTIDIEKLLKVLKTRDKKKIEKLVFQLTNKID